MPTKKALNEADICHQFITPAIDAAGWTKAQVRREWTFTAGKIIVRGELIARGKQKRADYMLFYKPSMQAIAVVEAKDNSHPLGAGMQQALAYAEALDVPFVFSSNGDGFQFHDRTGTFPEKERTFALGEFPSPEELWKHYKLWKGLEDADEELLIEPNYSQPGGKSPRYYQQLAINRTIEAIAKGQRRCLLVMATGTGKTYTAFNIIWRLWKARKCRRVLFLADRNILVDQTINNDFQPFGEAMHKLTRKLVDGSGRVNTSYEVYLSLYQAIMGAEDRKPIYDKFPPDFFDLIVIDECHRGSARADSQWREILDYFDSAIQVGLTATPKETKYVSNIDYFGKPVYTYSLKQGIEDGFLAPFKVIRVDLDVDLQGWRPEQNQFDDQGNLIEDRVYNQRDIDRSIVFPMRTKLVAERLSAFLHSTDPMHKTIVFCEDIDHADRMRRALVNVPANKPLVEADPRYVTRITGDDREGKGQLEHFINPKEKYPVIATTSKLMTTGVDAKDCHLIVLDQRITSMTEFKQTIGRGTRLAEEFGKYFFTIMDFRKATELFADPDWDGPPLQVYDPDGDDPVPPDPDPGGEDDIDEVLVDDENEYDPWATDDDEGEPRVKYVVGDQPFMVVAERVQYYGRDGKLITESLRDYTRRQVRLEYESLETFLRRWSEVDKKQAIFDELLEHGVILEALEDQVGADYDPFDLVCHVAFDQPPLTRRERANNVRKRDVFTKYGDAARAVLDALLDKYADEGLQHIEDIDVLKVEPLDRLGTPIELVRLFGGKRPYEGAVRALRGALYEEETA